MYPNEKVILYIDNSNIFINTQKFSAKKKGYLGGVQDWCCRIDIGRLVSEACGQRELMIGKLYGSEPPMLDSVWKRIREEKIIVSHSKRFNKNAREKRTDTSLSVEATQDLILKKDEAGTERTMILFTGDRDMLDIVHVAIKFQWMVEIWSYRHSLAKDFINEEKECKLVKIKYIDDVFDLITFDEIIWGRPIPPERSLVFKFETPVHANDCKKRLDYVISTCSKLFHLPFMGKFILGNTHDVILIPCISEYGKKGSDKANKLHEFISQISEDIELSPAETDRLHACITQCAENGMRSVSQKDHLHQFIKHQKESQIISDDQAEMIDNLINQIAVSIKQDESSKLYDFNRDIWNRIKEVKVRIKGCEIVTYFDYRAQQKGNHEYFYQTEKGLGDESTNIYDAAVAEGGSFTTVTRKQPRPSTIYSDPCKFGYRCKAGMKCLYKHRKIEKEFFKEHPIFYRPLYKSRPCPFRNCKYRNKSYLCRFAHDAPDAKVLTEARCLRCHKEADHWTDECPLKDIR